MIVGLFIAYGVILVLLASLRSIPVTNPLVQLLRVFFPSWKFFDDSGDIPHLWVRTATGTATASTTDTKDTEIVFCEWQPCIPSPARTWTTPFWNPKGNLRLAYDSLLMQLLMDVTDHSEQLSQTVSYRLTERLAAQHVATLPHASAVTRYQFKLTVTPASAILEPEQDILLSPIQECR